MKELAIKIHKADRFEAMATSQMASACAPGESLSQPKIHTPRKIDSRKKADSASMARGAPKISPTKREYSDQFIPNWNSCTIPVTTPMAKLIKRSFPQKRVIRLY